MLSNRNLLKTSPGKQLSNHKKIPQTQNAQTHIGRAAPRLTNPLQGFCIQGFADPEPAELGWFLHQKPVMFQGFVDPDHQN